jgi:hypothetical protein
LPRRDFFFMQRALVALRAGDAGVLGLLQRLDVLALGVAGAADELAVAPALDGQLGAALGAAAALDDLRLLGLGLVGVQVAGVVALRVVGAADEQPVAAQALGQLAAALGALLVDELLGDVLALDVLLGVVDAVLERLPELLQQRNPVLFAAGDGVEFVLQPAVKS